jgi:hypothetical protein
MTSKRDQVLTRGEGLLDWDFLTREYTEDDPGKIGNRDVPGGKNSRAIYMNRTPEFIKQMLYQPVISDYQSSIDRSIGAEGYESSNSFTLNKESGSVLFDHILGAHASSRNDILIDSADYSTFDSHQHWDNCRKFAISGIKLALEIKSYADSEFGEGHTVGDWIDIMWMEGQIRDGIFRSDYGGLEVFVALDILQSGEYMTINFNNVTNRSLFHDFMEEYRAEVDAIADRFVLLYRAFQGDDSIGFWSLPRNGYTIEALHIMVSTFVRSGGDNGFDLNQLKTVVRLFRYEYLKKSFIYGYPLPLRIVQIFTSETLNRDFQTQQITAYSSTLNVKISRGFDPIYASRLCLYTWMFRRAVKVPSYPLSINYYLPFCVYMLPKAEGGCGLSPHSILSANQDMPIMFRAHKNPRMLELLEYAHYIMSNDITNTRQLLADRLIQGLDTVPLDPLVNGRMYANRVKTEHYGKRISRAESANDELIALGHSIHRLSITNFTDSILSAAILDNTSVRSLSPIEKARTGPFMIAAAENLHRKPLPRFDWLKHIYIKYGDELEVNSDHGEIVWYAFDNLKQCFGTIGIASESKIRFSPGAILRILRKDRKFPRYINEEHIIDEINSINVLFDHELLRLKLISFGAKPELISEVIEIVSTSLDKFAILQAAGTVSLSDDVFSTLNTSSPNLELYINGTTGTEDLDALVYLLLTSMQIVDLPYTPFKQMDFVLGPGGLANIRSVIYKGRQVEGEDHSLISFGFEIDDPVSEGFF